MSQFHFDPESYLDLIRAEVPLYDELQEAAAKATEGREIGRLLDLGVGTGQTALAVLALHPSATVVGLDVSADMINLARKVLPEANFEALHVGDLSDPLPHGPFDLIISALAVHHLDAAGKRRLFPRLRKRLAAGGRLVLADVIEPEDSRNSVTPLDPRYDFPETIGNLLDWLRQAGFETRVTWAKQDLAVIVGEI